MHKKQADKSENNPNRLSAESPQTYSLFLYHTPAYLYYIRLYKRAQTCTVEYSELLFQFYMFLCGHWTRIRPLKDGLRSTIWYKALRANTVHASTNQ